MREDSERKKVLSRDSRHLKKLSEETDAENAMGVQLAHSFGVMPMPSSIQLSAQKKLLLTSFMLLSLISNFARAVDVDDQVAGEQADSCANSRAKMKTPMHDAETMKANNGSSVVVHGAHASSPANSFDHSGDSLNAGIVSGEFSKSEEKKRKSNNNSSSVKQLFDEAFYKTMEKRMNSKWSDETESKKTSIMDSYKLAEKAHLENRTRAFYEYVVRATLLDTRLSYGQVKSVLHHVSRHSDNLEYFVTVKNEISHVAKLFQLSDGSKDLGQFAYPLISQDVAEFYYQSAFYLFHRHKTLTDHHLLKIKRCFEEAKKWDKKGKFKYLSAWKGLSFLNQQSHEYYFIHYPEHEHITAELLALGASVSNDESAAFQLIRNMIEAGVGKAGLKSNSNALVHYCHDAVVRVIGSPYMDAKEMHFFDFACDGDKNNLSRQKLFCRFHYAAMHYFNSIVYFNLNDIGMAESSLAKALELGLRHWFDVKQFSSKNYARHLYHLGLHHISDGNLSNANIYFDALANLPGLNPSELSHYKSLKKAVVLMRTLPEKHSKNSHNVYDSSADFFYTNLHRLEGVETDIETILVDLVEGPYQGKMKDNLLIVNNLFNQHSPKTLDELSKFYRSVHDQGLWKFLVEYEVLFMPKILRESLPAMVWDEVSILFFPVKPLMDHVIWPLLKWGAHGYFDEMSILKCMKYPLSAFGSVANALADKLPDVPAPPFVEWFNHCLGVFGPFVVASIVLMTRRKKMRLEQEANVQTLQEPSPAELVDRLQQLTLVIEEIKKLLFLEENHHSTVGGASMTMPSAANDRISFHFSDAFKSFDSDYPCDLWRTFDLQCIYVKSEVFLDAIKTLSTSINCQFVVENDRVKFVVINGGEDSSADSDTCLRDFKKTLLKNAEIDREFLINALQQKDARYNFSDRHENMMKKLESISKNRKCVVEKFKFFSQVQLTDTQDCSGNVTRKYTAFRTYHSNNPSGALITDQTLEQLQAECQALPTSSVDDFDARHEAEDFFELKDFLDEISCLEKRYEEMSNRIKQGEKDLADKYQSGRAHLKKLEEAVLHDDKTQLDYPANRPSSPTL